MKPEEIRPEKYGQKNYFFLGHGAGHEWWAGHEHGAVRRGAWY